MCCFRFKLWWMTQRMGTSGRDVPLETQFMLLESRPGGAGAGDEDGGEPVYLVMLPLLEGQFRAALQGNERDELEITFESGKLSLLRAGLEVTSVFFNSFFPAGVCSDRWWCSGAGDVSGRGQGGADEAGDEHGVRARRDQPFRHHHSVCQVRSLLLNFF